MTSGNFALAARPAPLFFARGCDDSAGDVCRVCGFRKSRDLDRTLIWYFGMIEGNPNDGAVPEHVVLLREMKALRAESGALAPTAYDLWTLAAVFAVTVKPPQGVLPAFSIVFSARLHYNKSREAIKLSQRMKMNILKNDVRRTAP